MNHGKNILVLSSWYPTQAQPFLGNFVEQQIELIATTNTVTVIVLEAVDNSTPVHIQDQQIKGYREIRIRYSRGKNVINRYFNQLKAFKIGFNLLDKVDLIHAHVLLPKGHLFSMAKKRFNCPLIVTEQWKVGQRLSHGKPSSRFRHFGWRCVLHQSCFETGNLL